MSSKFPKVQSQLNEIEAKLNKALKEGFIDVNSPLIENVELKITEANFVSSLPQNDNDPTSLRIDTLPQNDNDPTNLRIDTLPQNDNDPTNLRIDTLPQNGTTRASREINPEECKLLNRQYPCGILYV